MEQHGKILYRKESGFSLIELLIYMALLGILMIMVFRSFIPVMQTSSRQWRIGETKIETGVGLDLLRGDLEHAGFGLPWEFPVGVTPSPYFEPAPLADVPNVPRAVISEDASASSMNTSDYLAIKALNVVLGASSQKWGWLGRDALHTASVQTLSDDAFVNTDRVIVLRPQVSPGVNRQLVLDGTSYFARPTTADLTPFAPPETANDPNGERYLVYGLDDIDPRRPFNRTDYYINAPTPANPQPGHCAPGTGTLVKATLNQANDNFTVLPIVDCVADFQVTYHLDTDGDGGCDDVDGIPGCDPTDANGLNGLTAKQIREQMKSIQCYVLTHEGGVDLTYTHPLDPVTGLPTINVGEVAVDGVTLLAGRAFDLNATIGATWANYRWKVYSLTVTPRNLQ
ncbi:MAG: prepilin-type N-terminal cleavage/methylation domain-containing protein [Desulfobulbaceae bacterium]|nr:prepilin-type N-terminal cleavage/methylation domain-containing protein [Desulfobulbaceae bacterium]HIJ90816.1 prepilin-type N-terminal cleavage/methylation domain-containing protein [Deltaproteobacteria bacterium]